MKVALISDIHDHVSHLHLALEQARKRRCSHLLCMGDMVTSDTFRTLCEAWMGELHVVFGNNEYERDVFHRLADAFPHVMLYGDEGQLQLDGRALYMTHLPRTAMRQTRAGYDAIFFGHIHERELLMLGKTLIVNPGEILGRRSHPSMAIYDTGDNSAEHFLL